MYVYMLFNVMFNIINYNYVSWVSSGWYHYYPINTVIHKKLFILQCQIAVQERLSYYHIYIFYLYKIIL